MPLSTKFGAMHNMRCTYNELQPEQALSPEDNTLIIMAAYLLARWILVVILAHCGGCGAGTSDDQDNSTATAGGNVSCPNIP